MERILTACFALLLPAFLLAQQIAGAEYFFDTDPGPGLGTAFSNGDVPAGNTSSSALTINASALVPGFHTLNVRYRDNTGVWGIALGQLVYVTSSQPGAPTPAPAIATAEYFFDTDPGPGLGAALSVPQGSTSTSAIPIDASALAPGLHIFNLRYRDAAGAWGMAKGALVYVSGSQAGETAPAIAAAEYFFDSDPGPGLGLALTVPQGSTSNSGIPIDAAALSPGFHTLNLRYRNAAGAWGLAVGRLVYVTGTQPGVVAPAPPIAAAEYFFDTDPGVGSATALTVSEGNTIDEQNLIDASALAMGAHVLAIRLRDTAGNWSIAKTQTFTVIQPPPAVNDDCSAAIALTVHLATQCPGQATNSTTLGATGSGGIACQSGTPADVWFSINTGVAQSMGVSLASITAGGLGLRVFDGCAGNAIYCGIGTAHVFNVTPSTNLVLQVFTVAQGTFSICAYDATQVEDCLGNAGGAALPGTACDDTNAATVGEVFDAQCVCVGYDCLGVLNGNTGPGSPCLAGTGPTGVPFFGVFNAQCQCTWTDCNAVPNGPAFAGQACNDGVASSPSSYLNAMCDCVPHDCAGVPNGPLMIGAPCAAGSYPVGALGPVINNSCACTWTDCMGTVNGNVLPGTPCNDGNSATSNDVYQANCQCAGVILDCMGVVNGPAMPGTACTLGGEAGSWSVGCTCIIPRPDLFVVNVTSAPSLVTPGDSVEVSWTVTNIGSASSTRNWIERIYAQSATGQNATLLRQVGYVEAGTLAAGSGVQRSKKVLVPVQFNAGDQCVFRVDLTPDGSITEVSGGWANNSTAQGTPWNVAKLLYIVPATVQLQEGAAPDNLSVRRTGSTSGSLTVNIVATNSDRFVLPTTVTFAAGQYATNLAISALENALLEGTIGSTVTASASGFTGATASVSIVDNEQPTLSFTSFPASTMEGNSYTFQVTTNLPPTSPLTVTLTSSNSARFPLPASVVIPMGATSVPVSVNLAQDNIPELDISVTVQAGASGHVPANAALLLADDDVPGIQLIISADTISEAGGIYATQAFLRRVVGSSPIAFTANLTASLPNTLIIPASLSLAAGQQQVQFNIGVVDNTLDDGYRNVTITAALAISGCGCSAPPTSAGYVTDHLVVVDNDGPALTVTPTPLTLAEGQSPAGQLRVQRNTATTAALSVSLFSSDVNEATVPSSVTIPSGSSYLDVPITTINDGTPDGSKVVFFNANAAGFSTGTAWAMVTDVNKPDLRITNTSVPVTLLPVLSGMAYSLTMTNSGFATAPSGVLVRGYLSSNTTVEATDVVLIEHYLAAPLPAGGNITVQGVVVVPDLPGIQQLLFVVNPLSAITELVYTNNAAPAVQLSIQPSYSAQATVDEPVHFRGLPVPLSGTATRLDGNPAAGVQVEVYVITNGLRREVMATTDASGSFSALFIPLSNEVGHYTAGADFPDLGATETQTEFDILGVRVNNGSLPQFLFTLGDTLQGTLPIRNLCTVPLPNVTIAPVSLPSGATVVFETIPVLGPSVNTTLAYTVTGDQVSPGFNYQNADLKVTSSLGDIQPCPAQYFCQAPAGHITTNPASITTTVSASMGERLVELRVVNNGAGSTGDISVSLPQVAWLGTMTPLNMPALAPGDTALVILRFIAHSSVPFNYPITGSVAINTQNGNDLAVPFTFTKVSESSGEVVVEVVNQFTYFAEGEPMVEGALVKIKNFYTGEVYAEGLTNSAGQFVATNVPEGTHRLTVDKAQHIPYSNVVEINPGASVFKSVFLSYQAVTFNWTVVPTTIEDSYTVILTTQFQTNVPIPVVTIDMPDTLAHIQGNEVFAFNVTLQNHGLVTAENVTLEFPIDPEYEFVTNYQPGPLAALTTIQVPVLMRVRDGSSQMDGTDGGTSVEEISQFLGMDLGAYDPFRDADLNCRDVVRMMYEYVCNEENGFIERSGDMYTYSERVCSNTTYGDGGLVGWTLNDIAQNGDWSCALCPSSDLTGAGNQNTGPGGAITNIADCRKCKNGLASALGDAANECIDELLPDSPWDLLPGVIQDVIDAFNNGYCLGTAIADMNSTVGSYLDCIPKPDFPIDPPCVGTFLAPIGDCFFSGLGVSTGMFGESSRSSDSSEVFVEMYQDLQMVVAAMEAHDLWAFHYYGELGELDAWSDLWPLLQATVEAEASFTPGDQAIILDAMVGYEVDPLLLQAFFDRWNATREAWAQEIYSPTAQYPDIMVRDSIIAWSDVIEAGIIRADERGYGTIGEMFGMTIDAIRAIVVSPAEDAVCASVTVQFSQQVTMTREAFTGTLGIFNGHPTDMMDSLAVNILITDMDDVPSNGLFHINTLSVGMLGDVTGTGQLEAQEEEAAVFQFIPTQAAAPTVPKQYQFGGSMTYWDPYAQAMTTLPFTPITLTVNPSPDLMLHYFLERNILGDDPLTEDETEPSVPAELAVMIDNLGYGAANNLIISSAQPEVVDNENGLAINFQLIGSNLQGQPANLGVTNISFGTVPPLQSRIGQWYMTSSLLGHFSDYDAQVVHNNSFGNPELSLVQGAELHELARSIRAYGAMDDGITDFLVNDLFDPFDVPDIIYFSQGDTTSPVVAADAGAFSGPVAMPTFTNVLSVTPDEAGWNYAKLNDPGNGEYNLVSVTRQDGQVIPLNNAWLTFVTLPVQQLPVYENKFHFVDRFTSLAEVDYTVVWTPKDTTRVQVDTIMVVPTAISAEQVEQFTVVFNKAINVASFSTDDLSLHFEGGPDLMNASVSIVQIDARTFNVVFGSLTTNNGTFDFSVEAMSISDTYGRPGIGVETVSWTQYHSVPAIEAFLGIPSPALATSYSTFAVRFNLPIDASTVTPERFALVFQGDTLATALSIDSVSSDLRTFYLSGLGALMVDDGLYQLVVDVPGIRTTSLAFGIAPQSISLALDNTGPQVTSLSTNTTGALDAQHITFIDIHLSEAVSALPVSALVLARNGSSLPINNVAVSMISPTHWRVGSLGLTTYNEGAYAFTMATNLLTDLLDNHGTGQDVMTWNVVRTTTLTIASPTISPDMGHSGNDKVTASLPLSIGFTLNEAAQQVQIFRLTPGNETLLASMSNVPSGTSSTPVLLPTGGNSTLKIAAQALNGISTSIQFGLFADVQPLTANWSTTSGQILTTPLAQASLQFSDALLDESAIADALTLTVNNLPLSTSGLSLTMTDATHLLIGGLDAMASTPGTYRLALDLADLAKYGSGATGVNTTELQWSIVPLNQSVKLALKAMLDGPYDPTAGRMHDSLRVAGSIPVADPYPTLGYVYLDDPGATISPSLFAVQGDNAIVDWVVVELRDKNEPAEVLHNQPALIQRDGDIIGTDGAWPLALDVVNDAYFIVLRHRNHLGVMSATPIPLSSATAVLDFTLPATSTFGTQAQSVANVRATLWSGDVNSDGILKYTGAQNDRDPILVTVGGAVPTNVITNAYSNADVNLDGRVKYVGEGNDRDPILQNIGGSVPTNVKEAQLP